MCRRLALVLFAISLGFVPARAQDKPTIVVHVFTIASGVKCPYDMTQLQAEAIAELKTQDAAQFNVVSDAVPNQTQVYTLDGEILEWHKGNVVERMTIAMGSVAGRENAKIHYWLTDKDGKKVFESTDIIRQIWMDNAKEQSTGTLGRPFGDKIADRLKEAKLVPAASAPAQ
ncbi:MAG: DUF4410 domain-containing protein [Candidatus Acidiferrales bacterium]|jgi:hypothetical protein